MLLIIKSVGSKNISFSSFKSNIFQNSILTIIFFLRDRYIVNCTTNLFSYHQKNVKNGKMIRNLGEFNSISISC